MGDNKHSKDNFQPYRIWVSLSGLLFLGVLVKGPIALLLLWFSSFLSVVGSHGFSEIFVTVVIAVVASEAIATCIDRIFVLYYQHVAPGGVINVTLQWMVMVIIAFISGWFITSSFVFAIICAGVIGIINLVEIIWLKAWQRGESQEEAHDKWEQTKEMTKEVFEDDWQEMRKRYTRNSVNDTVKSRRKIKVNDLFY